MRNVHRFLWPAVIAASGLLAACGGGGGGSPTGSMTLSITDAPVDGVQNVVVTFTGVELKPSNGAPFSVDFASPKSIDLLAMQGGKVTDLFTNQSVPAGHYDWLRLKVSADTSPSGTSYSSYVMVNGQEYNLVVPSGAQTGLKLVRGFTVAQGSATGFVIDFDLRKSLVAPVGQGGSYYLRPALRMMDQMQVGSIAGTVDLTALTAAQLPANSPVTDCKPGLYLFVGGAAMPDDYDGDANDDGGADPIWFEPVANDGATTTVSFSIPFVDASQTYTLAATCNFDVDGTTPDANTGVIPNDYHPVAQGNPDPLVGTMHWSTVGNVVVSAGSTTTVAVP